MKTTVNRSVLSELWVNPNRKNAKVWMENPKQQTFNNNNRDVITDKIHIHYIPNVLDISCTKFEEYKYSKELKDVDVIYCTSIKCIMLFAPLNRRIVTSKFVFKELETFHAKFAQAVVNTNKILLLDEELETINKESETKFWEHFIEKNSLKLKQNPTLEVLNYNKNEAIQFFLKLSIPSSSCFVGQIAFTSSSSSSFTPNQKQCVLPSDRSCDSQCGQDGHQFRSDLGGCIENVGTSCSFPSFYACSFDQTYFSQCEADCNVVFGRELKFEAVKKSTVSISAVTLFGLGLTLGLLFARISWVNPLLEKYEKDDGSDHD